MKKKSWVKAGPEWIDLNKKGVVFEDIEEDLWGKDRVTFLYKGVRYESHVIISHTRPN
jgi:hypothetical protein